MDYQKLKSGTDIRGVACEGAGYELDLTDEVVMRIADGFLLWCEKHLGKAASEMKLSMGYDSRISADRIAAAVQKSFMRRGVLLFDCGLSSTPSMFMAVLELPCDASVQITASHHPWFRNGLKFFTKDGGLNSPDITEILTYAANGDAPAKSPGGKTLECGFMQRYAEILRDVVKKEVNSIDYDRPLDGFRIVVDAGNGAGGFYAGTVLAPLGADISGSIFLEPDGMFPNHIPNPENAEAMQAVSKATLRVGADLGVIFDTDVDRGAAVDHRGNEISRNRLVALASAIALEKSPGGMIVTDSITSDGLKDFIENTLHGKHYRFQRGYKNVINEALRLNREGIDCPLAIETSGHAAMRENYFLDDGAYLVTKIIIKMAVLRREGRTIDDLLLPLKEPVEATEKRIPIPEEDFRTFGERVIEDLAQYAAVRNWDIAPDNHEGIRISFPKNDGDGWFLLRLSVHDPIMPLNLESNTPGGTKLLLNHIKEFASEKYADMFAVCFL